LPDAFQERLHPDPGLDPGNGQTIHPGRLGPGVGLHPLPGVHQERRIVDEVEQVIEPAGLVLGRPAVQLDLHSPYREQRRLDRRPLHGAGVHQRVFGHCNPLLV
jgi:hypothetical protein